MYNFENFKDCGMSKILLGNIIVNGVLSDVLIEGERISDISPAGSMNEADSEHTHGAEFFDCRGMTAFPGFVNMHTHAGMSMMRGVGEDIAFHEWLANIWKIEKDLTPEYVYHATRMACLEMIKTGTTTFNDHYWYHSEGQRAAAEMGLRGVHAYVICDRNDPAESDRQKRQCMEMYELSLNWPSTSIFAIAIHAIYSVSEQMILWATEFARERGLKIHIHVSETRKEIEDCMTQHDGMSPVEYLDSLGVLGPDVIAAHT